MVTTAFFLERRNAVRPITILKTIGPKKKEKIDTTSGLTVVGSKATTSRSLSRQRIARTKFSKMEYINGPVRITKMFLQYKARINPKVITKRLTIIALTSDSGFFLGGNVIAALVWCIIGVCFLIGYALAIFIYKHRK